MRARQPAAWGVLALLCATAVARAEPMCAVKLQGGEVRLDPPLTAEWSGSSSGRRCVASVAKALYKNRLLRAVTIAYRVPDAQRLDGRALAVARALAEGLVAAGLPHSRVFAVAPAAGGSDAPRFVIRYTERAPELVVARIGDLSGSVLVGEGEASLRPAEPGMPLLPEDLLRTGPDGRALLEMKDGSALRLLRNTQVKLVRLYFDGSGDRTVRVEVLRGQIEAEVCKSAPGSSFDAGSRLAVASVHGTAFRFGVGVNGTAAAQLETLDGSVSFRSVVQHAPPLEVPRGQGARTLPGGAPSPLQALPPPPALLTPLRGTLAPQGVLMFEGVRGAVRYRVEVARDADFVLDVTEHITEGTTLAFGRPPAPGKWFWRVTAINAAGFAGLPSLVYAFTVP